MSDIKVDSESQVTMVRCRCCGELYPADSVHKCQGMSFTKMDRDFDIAYSDLTERYYFVLGNKKYDITEFVSKKTKQARTDAIDEFAQKIMDIMPNDIDARVHNGSICLDILALAEQLKEKTE